MTMHSMTGFGQAERNEQGWQIRVRIAAVNRRQQDLQIQLPREFAALEPRVRERVLPRFSRGRLQLTGELEARGAAGIESIDVESARTAARQLRAIRDELELEGPLTLDALLRIPGVLQTGQTSSEGVETAGRLLEAAVDDAVDALRQMQQTEGIALAADCRNRLEFLESKLSEIEGLAPGVPVRHREVLTQRIQKALAEIPIDEERLAREIAFFADRTDISEEITRARLHLQGFREKLASEETPGRVLDFLAQELAREFNTISSKANDAAIAERVVLCKAEIEKIREQVQNIE